MFEMLKSGLCNAISYLLPKRKNFELVEKLNVRDITTLPSSPPVLDHPWITALFQYKHPTVKAIIWELKYRGNTLPLEHIARMMFDGIQAEISDIVLFDSDAEFLLIPIPVTPSRRAERGYNQSEYICRAIVAADTARILLYAPQWLEKTRETQSQSHSQSREDRKSNLVGCFSANPQVQGKYVILVDDVVTTGSTLSVARHTLLEAGARDVFAFTIAH